MCGLFSSPQLLVRICIISERVSSHNVGLPLELVGVLRNKNYSLRFLFDSRVIGTERLSNQYSDSVQKGKKGRTSVYQKSQRYLKLSVGCIDR